MQALSEKQKFKYFDEYLRLTMSESIGCTQSLMIWSHQYYTLRSDPH